MGQGRFAHPFWSHRIATGSSDITGPSVPGYSIFKDMDNRTVLLELRGNGRQTLVPPSVHPDGESYIWHGPLEPAQVDGTKLELAVHRLAAATLLARHWPSVPGSRHDVANALAGMLTRGGWSEQDTARFVGSVASAAGGSKLDAAVEAFLELTIEYEEKRWWRPWPYDRTPVSMYRVWFLAALFAEVVIISIMLVNFRADLTIPMP